MATMASFLLRSFVVIALRKVERILSLVLAPSTKNAHAKQAIQTIMYMAQTFMVHAALHWTGHVLDDLSLWSFAVKH